MRGDSLLVELEILREEMRGINPKVSSYLKLKERELEIVKLLGGDSRKDFDSLNLLEKPRNNYCESPGCKNKGASKQRKRLDGTVARYKFCEKHREKNREYRRQWSPEEKAARTNLQALKQ